MMEIDLAGSCPETPITADQLSDEATEDVESKQPIIKTSPKVLFQLFAMLDSLIVSVSNFVTWAPSLIHYRRIRLEGYNILGIFYVVSCCSCPLSKDKTKEWRSMIRASLI